MTTQNKSPMIIIERPHQRPATVWIAWGQDDFIRKVSGMRRMENYTFDPDVDGGAVLSRHERHELAERKIRRNYPGGFCRITHEGD